MVKKLPELVDGDDVVFGLEPFAVTVPAELAELPLVEPSLLVTKRLSAEIMANLDKATTKNVHKAKLNAQNETGNN